MTLMRAMAVARPVPKTVPRRPKTATNDGTVARILIPATPGTEQIRLCFVAQIGSPVTGRGSSRQVTKSVVPD
jgi:hypothetical protein